MKDWLERVEERASLCSMCEETPTYTPEEVARLIGLFRAEQHEAGKLQAKLDAALADADRLAEVLQQFDTLPEVEKALAQHDALKKDKHENA